MLIQNYAHRINYFIYYSINIKKLNRTWIVKYKKVKGLLFE